MGDDGAALERQRSLGLKRPAAVGLTQPAEVRQLDSVPRFWPPRGPGPALAQRGNLCSAGCRSLPLRLTPGPAAQPRPSTLEECLELGLHPGNPPDLPMSSCFLLMSWCVPLRGPKQVQCP